MSVLRDQILSTFSLSLLYISVVFQFYLTAAPLSRGLVYMIVYLCLLTVPVIITNIVSGVLCVRSFDEEVSNSTRLQCLVTHLFHIGLAWRLWRLLNSYDEEKTKTFTLLILGQVLTGCLPAAIIEVYVIKQTGIIWYSGLFIIITVLASSIIIAHAQSALSTAISEDRIVTALKENMLLVFSVVGVACLLVSRGLSLTLFYESKTYWLGLFIGVHFIICFIPGLISRRNEGRLSVKQASTAFAFAYIDIFDSLHTGTRRTKCEHVLFYALILVENIIMSAVWMIDVAIRDSSSIKLAIVMIMLVTFVLGILLKFSQNVCSGSSDSDFDPETKILEIVDGISRASSERLSKMSQDHQLQHTSAQRAKNTADVLIGNHGVFGEKDLQTAFCNPAFEHHECVHPRHICRSTYLTSSGHSSQHIPRKRTLSGRSKDRPLSHPCFSLSDTSTLTTTITNGGTNRPKNRGKRRSRHPRHEESTDLDSSNSRNTNTIDMSGSAGHTGGTSGSGVHCRNCSGIRVDTLTDPHHKGNRIVQSKNGFKTNKQGINRNQPNPLGQTKYIQKDKQHLETSKGLMLNPSLLLLKNLTYAAPPGSDLISYGGTYTSQSADCYLTDNTSYLDSYSYLDPRSESSDSLSSSSSEFANTWPPSSHAGMEVKDLPGEKLSPAERISSWIKDSTQYFSDEHLNNLSENKHNAHDAQPMRTRVAKSEHSQPSSKPYEVDDQTFRQQLLDSNRKFLKTMRSKTPQLQYPSTQKPNHSQQGNIQSYQNHQHVNTHNSSIRPGIRTNVSPRSTKQYYPGNELQSRLGHLHPKLHVDYAAGFVNLHHSANVPSQSPREHTGMHKQLPVSSRQYHSGRDEMGMHQNHFTFKDAYRDNTQGRGGLESIV